MSPSLCKCLIQYVLQSWDMVGCTTQLNNITYPHMCFLSLPFEHFVFDALKISCIASGQFLKPNKYVLEHKEGMKEGFEWSFCLRYVSIYHQRITSVWWVILIWLRIFPCFDRRCWVGNLGKIMFIIQIVGYMACCIFCSFKRFIKFL